MALSVLNKGRTWSKRTQERTVSLELCVRFQQIDSVDSSRNRIALGSS